MATRSRDCTGSKMEPKLNGLRPELTDEQWSLIADLFPDKPVGAKGGRPRARSRDCFEGILWVLRSGARWKDMPSRFPSYVTGWRRFAKWSIDGVWDIAMERLLAELDRRGQIDWNEGFADATFASAKKGVIASARHAEAREQRSWCWRTAKVCRSPSTSKPPTAPRSI